MRPDSASGAFARLVHMRAEAGDEGAQSRLDGGVDDQPLAIEHLAGARDHQAAFEPGRGAQRSEEHTSELQSLMRISYAVFCLKKKKKTYIYHYVIQSHNNSTTKI